MKKAKDVALTILEGEVVNFRGKPEKFGADDKVRFKQFHGSPSKSYLNHIKAKHPAAHEVFKKIHDHSDHTITRTFASEIHKNDKHVGYMVNHWHAHPKPGKKKDEWDRDFETHHAHDIHGHKIGMTPVPLSSLGEAKKQMSNDDHIMALHGAHEKEAKRHKAEFHNFGWGQDGDDHEDVISSKTSRGILASRRHRVTGKVEHDWND